MGRTADFVSSCLAASAFQHCPAEALEFQQLFAHLNFRLIARV